MTTFIFIAIVVLLLIAMFNIEKRISLLETNCKRLNDALIHCLHISGAVANSNKQLATAMEDAVNEVEELSQLLNKIFNDNAK